MSAERSIDTQIDGAVVRLRSAYQWISALEQFQKIADAVPISVRVREICFP